MSAVDNQRMLDLLRVCRGELFGEHNLITEEEYAWLASLPSKATHARLKDYDTLRAELAATKAREERLREALERFDPFLDEAEAAMCILRDREAPGGAVKRSRREVRATVERIEAVGCANIGDEERPLLLRPNDLRRVVDHIDATDAEVKRLRREKAAQRRALESFETDIRYLFDRREAESIIDKAKTAALKPKRKR